MIYDKIDEKLIKLGKSQLFNKDETKLITPIYYDGDQFDLSLKNKYVKIEGIEENIYGKNFITIKSKLYADLIETIVNKLDVTSPITTDGSIRATVNDKTKISENVEKLKNVKFNACISLTFPTIFEDKSTNKKTLQVHVKDIVITKIIEEDLEVDFDKLEIAI